MSMSYKIRQRAGFRAQVTRHIKTVEGFWIKKNNLSSNDLSDIMIVQGKLEKLESQLETLNEEIGSSLNDETEIDDEVDKSSEIRESLWDAILKIAQLLSPSSSIEGDDANSAISSRQVGKPATKLPKLTLAKFDGNPLLWQEFWDSYKISIHDNTDLSPVEKFQHLKALLTDDAKSVADGYRLTDANYTTVVEVLAERFSSEEVAVFAHFEKLLALPVSSGETHKLQITYDETEKHIRSLVSLGLEEEVFGQVFTPIILSKLPRGLRVEQHRRNGSVKWQLSTLRNLFREELKARQMADWTIEKGKGETKDEKSFKKFNGQTSQKFNKPTASALVQEGADKNRLKYPCVFCGGDHFPDSCTKVTSVTSRKEMLKGSCFRCLGRGHFPQNCKRQKPCFYCKRNSHHSCLCPQQFGNKADSKSASKAGPTTNPTPAKSAVVLNADAPTFVSANESSCTAASNISTNKLSDKFVHMQTALVQFGEGNVRARLFFDTGSSRSYITQSLTNSLKLSACGNEILSNARFEDSTRRTRNYKKVELFIPTSVGSIPISCLITKNIACAISRCPVKYTIYPILNKISLADPPSSTLKNVSIDILIGSDYYYHIIGKERIDLKGGLVLLESKLGYIISGCSTVDREFGSSETYLTALFCHGQSCVSHQNFDLERFWLLEEIGVKDDSYVKDDELVLQRFNESVQFKDGRFEVGWPWKSNHPELPDNYDLSFGRLCSLHKRLTKDKDVMETYDSTIKQQLNMGIIEEVKETTTENLVHYLPHHCIIKPDRSTTKLRVVYDASSKAHNSLLSLNDCLLRGPVFLQDLCGLFLRFRTYPYAVISDIEKAFLQILIRPMDRDVTRFLWLKDKFGFVCEDNLVTYRFCRVLFGIISSPFLLDATIKY